MAKYRHRNFAATGVRRDILSTGENARCNNIARARLPPIAAAAPSRMAAPTNRRLNNENMSNDNIKFRQAARVACRHNVGERRRGGIYNVALANKLRNGRPRLDGDGR